MPGFLNQFGRREFGLAIAVLLFSAIALSFTFLIYPDIKEYRNVSDTEGSLIQLVGQGDQLQQQLLNMEALVADLEHQLHGDMASLPEKEIEAHVVGQLQRLSWQNKIQLVGVEPSAGETIEPFKELLFRVNLVGDYYDLYQWLGDVSDELGFVMIKQFEMRSGESTDDGPQLSVGLTMATYRALL